MGQSFRSRYQWKVLQMKPIFMCSLAHSLHPIHDTFHTNQHKKSYIMAFVCPSPGGKIDFYGLRSNFILAITASERETHPQKKSSCQSHNSPERDVWGQARPLIWLTRFYYLFLSCDVSRGDNEETESFLVDALHKPSTKRVGVIICSRRTCRVKLAPAVSLWLKILPNSQQFLEEFFITFKSLLGGGAPSQIYLPLIREHLPLFSLTMKLYRETQQRQTKLVVLCSL